MKYRKIIFFFYLIIFISCDFLLTNIFILSRNILLDDPTIDNDVYHHDLKKNYESYGIINTKIFTNSLGFRDFKIRNIDINSKKKRILLMGDSFTYGLDNNYENSFAGLITKNFEKKNIEVLNGALTSYSPIIYFKKIEYLIKETKLEFDEVFLFIDISDTYDDLYRYRLNKEGNVVDNNKIEKINSKKNIKQKTKTFVSQNFTIIFIILDFMNDLISPDKFPRHLWAINHRNSRWNWNLNYRSEAADGLNLNRLYMNKLKNLLDEKSIKLKIIIYPWPSSLMYRKNKTIYENNWEEWANSNNVKIFNFLENFNYTKNLDKREKLKIIRQLYHINDMHFNTEGSKLFYDKIINFLYQ